MSTVIKVTAAPRAIQGVAFSFDDMAGRANDYLTDVRAQAGQILAQAQQQAAEIRRRAEAEGRTAALAAAEKVLNEKVAQRMETLLPALRKVIDDVQAARQAWLNDWEKRSIHVAAALAARVVRRQLPQFPEIPGELLREALQLAAGSPQLQIHLHPADYDTLRDQIPRLVQECARGAKAEVVADPSISPGGCRIETQHGVIDQQLEVQLARIEEELTL